MANDNEIISSVFNKVINQDGYAFDNIFTKVPLVQYMLVKDAKEADKLMTNKRVKKLDGGNKIEFPLEYAVGTTAQSYSGYDTIGFTPKETIKNAEEEWRHIVQTLVLDNKDILKISGQAKKIADYVGSKMRNMMKSFATTMNTQLMAASPGTDDFNSIQHFIRKDPTASATIAGLDQSTYSWWRNKTAESTATTLQELINEVVNLKNTIAENIAGDYPDLAITDQTVFEYFIQYLSSKGMHNFRNEEMSTALNVDVNKVRGMDVIWDSGLPEVDNGQSQVYLANTDYLQLCVHQDRQFEVTKEGINMLAGQGQDAIGWAVFLMGNLTCSNRSKQGILYSIAQNISS